MRPLTSRQTPDTILSIRDLHVEFQTSRGKIFAISGIDLDIHTGDVFGIVGESGCGKSVTTLAIMGLLPSNARVTRGEILFEGTDLLKLSQSQLAKIRASRIGMVFQDSTAALDPLYRIGQQVAEPMMYHPQNLAAGRRDHLSKNEIKRRVVELLELVRIPKVERVMECYPHQLSGGMKQRVMIATALALDPSMLILDEPTTGLDVTIQDEILTLLREIRGRLNTTILLISHDFGVIAQMCQKVAVMYSGRIAEVSSIADMLREPMHPYTRALLKSVPTLKTEVSQLVAIPGTVSNLSSIPVGCNFYNRCPQAMKVCLEVDPLPVVKPGTDHSVRCHLYGPPPPDPRRSG